MKKFLFKLSFLLVIPLCIIALNVMQDPFHDVAPTAIEYNAVDSLLQQKRAPLEGHINLRQVRKLQLTRQTPGVDLAVFGGSTMLELGSKQLSPIKVQNFSVPNHSLEDQLGLYHLYANNAHVACKHFVLGLSPYFFMAERSSQTRWLPLKDEYLSMLSKLKQPRLLPAVDAELIRFKQLLSIDLARRSFTTFTKLRPQGDVLETSWPRILPDGSWNKMSFSDSLAKHHRIRPPVFAPRFSPTSEIDERRLRLLLELLVIAQKKHEKVFVILTPYAPSFYTHLKEQNEEVVLIEHRLHELCENRGITVVGSFNPENLQLKEADFMDPLHWHPKAMSAYFRRIKLAQIIEPLSPK